jgi:hypothetical protein
MRTPDAEILPDCVLRPRGDPRAALDVLAAIGRADANWKGVEIERIDGGDDGCVLRMTWAGPTPVEAPRGLDFDFALCSDDKRSGALRVEARAEEWQHDEATQDDYRSALARLQPLIAEYRRRTGERVRLRIQSSRSIERARRPDLPPTAAAAFRAFVHSANWSCLHPLDWDRFYRFVWTCVRHRVAVDDEQVSELLRAERVPPDRCEELGRLFNRLRKFATVERRYAYCDVTSRL